MKISKIIDAVGGSLVTDCNFEDRSVTSCYVCDFLSHALTRLSPGCVWVTVMTNINVIGVASAAGVCCILLADGVPLEQEALIEANRENIPVISCSLPAYQCAKRLSDYI